MVVIGADLHKRTHTLVAVDETGRKLAEKTVAATPDGAPRAPPLGRRAGRSGRWAWRTAATSRAGLERDLLRAGERVVRVPPKLMAGARRSVREPGKSDPIDALAVARAALREPDLPVAMLDGPERELRLLVDHREDLVAERTRHEQPPALAPPRARPVDEPAPRSLDRAVVLDRPRGRASPDGPGPVARIARDLRRAGSAS